MKVTYNKLNEPSIELTKEETKQLVDTGSVYDNENKIGVMFYGDKILVLKPFDEYDNISLYIKGK